MEQNGAKRKKKWIWIVILVIVVILVAYSLLRPKASDTISLEGIATSPLTKEDLVSSVNVSGLVESESNHKVYAKLSTYTVESINVKEGDMVKAGDVLCTLDVSSIEAQIEQQEAAVQAADEAANAQVSSAQRNYSTAKNQYEEGRNTSVVSAEQGRDNAQTQLESAEKQYENSLVLYDLGEISSSDLDDALTAKTNAEKTLADAEKNLSDAIKNAEDSVKTAADSVADAKAATDTTSQKLAIQELRERLQDATIVSPIDGTVTLVSATEGSAATGVLFVVEDTEALIINTSIKEYNMPLVELGQSVLIKSDATGDAEFEGIVSYIAPTAKKTATGDQASSSSVEFEVEIAVTDTSTDLKIGMNTQIYIITSEVEDVFAVPYSAVTQNESGQNVIYVIETVDEKSSLRIIPVETGMESDYYIEVNSNELVDGMEVVISPTELAESAPAPSTTTDSPETTDDMTQSGNEEVGNSEMDDNGSNSGEQSAVDPPETVQPAVEQQEEGS